MTDKRDKFLFLFTSGLNTLLLAENAQLRAENAELKQKLNKKWWQVWK